MKITIEDIRKKDQNARDKGLWKTGQDKYVDIKQIDDIEYLQKILYVLSKREDNAHFEIARAIAKLEIAGEFYLHVLERLEELKASSKLTQSISFIKHPLYDTVNDPDLKALRVKIEKKIVNLKS